MCFPGGWIWILRFNNGLTSAGAALTDARAAAIGAADGEAAWHRLLAQLPAVKDQFDQARAAAVADNRFPLLGQLVFRSARIRSTAPTASRSSNGAFPR